MEDFRVFLGLVIVILMPMVIAFWLTIHLGAPFWRRQQAWVAYVSAAVVIGCVTWFTVSYRTLLLGTDLGLIWPVFLLGAIIYSASWVFWLPIRRRLSFKTFAGVPEVTAQKTELLSDGPFSLVRHPRYFMVLIGVVGWCMMANFAGAYLIGALSFAGLLLIVRLEERDLVERFGDAYREYQTRVPQILPKPADFIAYIREGRP